MLMLNLKRWGSWDAYDNSFVILIEKNVRLTDIIPTVLFGISLNVVIQRRLSTIKVLSICSFIRGLKAEEFR
jgi:hypothetical protein